MLTGDRVVPVGRRCELGRCIFMGRSAARDRARKADFETEAHEYWARIGHGFDVINYSRSRISGPKVRAHKALRYIAS